MLDFVNRRQEMFNELVKSMGIPARLLDPDKATVYDKFMDDIEANPNDFTLRSIFADWCEDHDRSDLAACLRWMVENKKRPYFTGESQLHWYSISKRTGSGYDPESDIPDAIYELLLGYKEAYGTVSLKLYDSFRAAEEAFHHAWLAAREKGEVTCLTRNGWK